MEQIPVEPTVADELADDLAADRAAVGTAIFPRSAADLRSTSQCPACFTPLRSLVCSRCGLDLGQPAAIDLAAQSALIADQLDARLALIGRVRRQAATSRDTPATEVPTAPAEATAVSGVRAAAPPPATTPVDSRPHTDATRPRRSGIQIALIVVGISLLSVFAVFGLVYAFVAYGSGVRTLIVVAGTLATLAAASVLARRGLGSTAEGIAALGTVILVLDAWALRENDPSGLGSLPGLPYWGVALIVVAAVSVAWSAVGRHTTPLLAAGALFPLGAALLAADITSEAPEGVSWATAGVVAGAAALVTPVLAGRRTPAVRGALTVLTAAVVTIGLVTALVSALWLAGASSVIPGILLASAAAAVAVLHVAVTLASRTTTLSGPGRRVVTATLSGLGTVTVLALLISAAATVTAIEVTLGVAILASASVALKAEFALHRWSTPERFAPLIAAAATAGFVAVVASLLALIPALRPLFDATVVAALDRPGQLSPDGAVAVPESAEVAFLACLALALGMATLTWAIAGVLRHRGHILAPILAVVLVAAVPYLQIWWIVATLLAIAALASPLLIGVLNSGRPDTAAARAATIGGLVTLAPLAALSLALLAWSVDGAGLAGIIVALLSLAAGRGVTTDPTARAVAIGVGALLVLTTGPTLAEDITAAGVTLSGEAMVIAIAALLLLLTALGRLSRRDAGVAAAAAAVIGAIVVAASSTSSLDTTLAVAALVVGLAVVGIRRPGIERSIVAAIAPLGAAVVVDRSLATADVLGALNTSTDERLLATLSAFLIMTVIAFACDRDGHDGVGRFARPRVLADAVTLVLLVAVVTAISSDELRTIGLLIGALAVLIMAVSRDGLLRSASPRRFIGWLSLALAVVALWQWLAQRDVVDPEPYVLPLAGALAIIGVLLARPTPRRDSASYGRAERILDISGATVALVTGLAVALLPLALTAGSGPAWRGAAVGTLAVLAVIAGLRAATRRSSDRVPLALSGVGLGTLVVALAAQVLLATSVVIDLTETVGPDALPPLSQLSGVLIVVMLTLTALAVWADSAGAVLRPVQVTAALSAGSAALAAGALGLARAVEPVEFLSLPLALGLLTIGTLELERRPEARSLPWLTPGFLALLVPSLIEIESDDSLWRVVALGLAAAAVFLGGLWRRLQSPFLVGAIVLLTHLVIQSWPLLRDVGEAVEWWLWLGLAGVVVVAIAARYERRVQNLKNAARRIRDLR